jgi:peptidoglycan hydrolase CwlO-like protein
MTTESLLKQIEELESKIASNIGDVQELKRKLNRLKIHEFEEDLKEQDNRRLLQE